MAEGLADIGDNTQPNITDSSDESLIALSYESSAFEEPIRGQGEILPYQFEPSDSSSDNNWEVDSLEDFGNQDNDIEEEHGRLMDLAWYAYTTVHIQYII